MKWIVALIVAGLLAAGGTWYFLGGNDTAPQYQTAQVTRGNLQQVVTATGQLTPVVNVQVGSQISGRIKEVGADFNSTVTSNQIIAKIDASTYELSVLRAQAQLTNAVANLALARVEARRAETLFAEKLISAADHDLAIAQLLQAEAAVTTAEANVESAEVDLSRCTIYAPVDGVVISRNVEVGQTVAASFNTPTLFIIANDLSKMQIGALISEADIGGVTTNQHVNFTVDAYPYRTFHGFVSQIRYGPVTNQNVVNYAAIIDVNNDDLKLLPGMTANVSIIVAERENVLKIPNGALRFRLPESAVAKTNVVTQAPAAGGRGEAASRSGAFAQVGGGGGGGGGFRRGGPDGGGRGPGARGPGGGARPDRPGNRTVYILKPGGNSAQPELEQVSIRTGINDGISTEVISGLNEGDTVVTGLILQENDAPAPRGGPTSPFGGRRRR